jgi:hypothetical protein
MLFVAALEQRESGPATARCGEPRPRELLAGVSADRLAVGDRVQELRGAGAQGHGWAMIGIKGARPLRLAAAF